MSKAEKFIQDSTMNGSNQIINGNYGTIIPYFTPWLTPDQARKAVEIAREEAIEQTADWLTKHAIKYYINSKDFLGTDVLVEDYKLIMTMNDET
jgi:hypothetical protein